MRRRVGTAGTNIIVDEPLEQVWTPEWLALANHHATSGCSTDRVIERSISTWSREAGGVRARAAVWVGAGVGYGALVRLEGAGRVVLTVLRAVAVEVGGGVDEGVEGDFDHGCAVRWRGLSLDEGGVVGGLEVILGIKDRALVAGQRRGGE